MKARGGFAKLIKDAKRPVMIVGAGAYARPDGAAVQALCHGVAEKLKIVRKDWNGFNLLQNAASRVGGLDIGFVPEGNAKGFDHIRFYISQQISKATKTSGSPLREDDKLHEEDELLK